VKYLLNENDGVFTIKNKNTTISFDRFNDIGEIEYIFVNLFFKKKGLAKKYLRYLRKKLEKRLCYRNLLVHWKQNY
jgi:hypothetical protein|tara:strand:+ start:1052 stop:1279 length:228 start_codon:yes stop_codon:yes gene_type:complete